MRIKSIEAIEPKAARCIEVDAPDRLFAAGGEDGHSVITHNSVVQRNIILGTILRPNNWRFLGIDLKKVDLSGFRAYSNVVLGVATTLEDALVVLRFAQETMMKRYAELEQLGLNNFLDLPELSQALLVMIDEAGELLGSSGVKALSEATPVLTPTGRKPLRDIQVGDTVFDNHSQETTVVKKYEPQEQSRYSLTISKDSTGEREDLVAGSEHYWVAYFQDPTGHITGPETVDTAYLHRLQEEQAHLPQEERTTVKFRKLSPSK